jgi:hypothetical protein
LPIRIIPIHHGGVMPIILTNTSNDLTETSLGIKTTRKEMKVTIGEPSLISELPGSWLYKIYNKSSGIRITKIKTRIFRTKRENVQNTMRLRIRCVVYEKFRKHSSQFLHKQKKYTEAKAKL